MTACASQSEAVRSYSIKCKNGLGERKSWAGRATAKYANVPFLCLAHLLEAKPETEGQGNNEAERSSTR